MTLININQFFGYSEKCFYDYLRLHRTCFIEVVIPKNSTHNQPELVIDDFYRAIYTGQLLSRISEDCLFNLPDPGTKGEFGFIISTKQFKKLAGILFLLSQAYDHDNHPEPSLAFSKTAAYIEHYLMENEELWCQLYLDMLEDLSDDCNPG